MELSIQAEIDRCIQQENRCIEDWHKTGEWGALLGLNDWFCEECILRKYERDKEI